MKNMMRMLLLTLLLAGTVFAQDDADSATTDTDTSDTAATSDDTTSGEDSASSDTGDTGSSGSGGSGTKWDISVESIVIDGETWSRISAKPIISLGKVKLSFDVEAYLSPEGTFDKRGWEIFVPKEESSNGSIYPSPQARFESLLSKIYFIQYNDLNKVVFGSDPKDKFYFKVGALDDVTLGFGIAMRNYCNTLDYPGTKQTGLDLAMHKKEGALGFGFRLMANNIGDFSRGGPVIGGRVFIRPFGKASSGILKRLQIGASLAADINQYSALKDLDGDSVPDEVDAFYEDPTRTGDYDGDGYADEEDTDTDGDQLIDSEILNFTEQTNLEAQLDAAFGTSTSNWNYIDTNVEYKAPFSLEDVDSDFFGVGAIDFSLPLNKKGNLWLYGQVAYNVDQKNDTDTNKANGYGLAPGIALRTKFLDASFEYRFSDGDFLFNYFGYNYNNERVKFNTNDDSFTTSDNYRLISEKKNGVYGDITFKLGGVIDLGITYQHLFLAGDATNAAGENYFASYEGKLGVNQKLLEQVKVISALEAFIMKTSVLDYEKFFKATPELLWGFEIGLQPGESGANFVYEFQQSWDYDENGELVPNKYMNIGVKSSF